MHRMFYRRNAIDLKMSFQPFLEPLAKIGNIASISFELELKIYLKTKRIMKLSFDI